MPLNPLSELKRRLEDDTTPLTKRLCLAKNIVLSHHFPSAPKQRIVSEWLEEQKGGIDSGELRKLLNWLGSGEELTGELKSRLIHVVSEYIQNNDLEKKEKDFIVTFLENDKISSQISQITDEFLTISITLLRNMKRDNSEFDLIRKILANFSKHYRESKKKLEFVNKLLQGDHLQVIFSYLVTDIRSSVIDVCKNILFPLNKRQFFFNYLQTLIWKDNLDGLIAEKGDNIQSVLKIMATFFNSNKILTENDTLFMKNFIDVFVTCFKSKSQVVFAFYILIANVFEMENVNITPSTKMTPITFTENQEKSKRNLFLNMLEILLKNEINISVRLTDKLGERESKVNIKNNFSSLLQSVMMGQLKLEGKADKITINIITTALKLDPSLIQDKIEIIPKIMSLKKSTNVSESYVEMLNFLIKTLFKLSRGMIFINQILPSLKLNLESSNTEQKELWAKIKENDQNGFDSEKLKLKIITANDILPVECIEMYGKLTMDLMFRQNKELLESLQRDFEGNCLNALEEGLVDQSTLTLTEVLSAILSSFFRHNKMADHTVARHIAEEFWELFEIFERDCLKRFGDCVLKLDQEQSLLKPFLQLCLSFSQLKLLNIKYSNNKLDLNVNNTSTVYDLSTILPCLDSEQWIAISERADEDSRVILNDLILIQTMAIELETIRNSTEINEIGAEAKPFLIKQLATNQTLLQTNYIPKALFNNLQKDQSKHLAKILLKNYFSGNLPETANVAMTNNKNLLNYLVLEVTKNITKCLDNCESLSKALNKADFDIFDFAKENDMKSYFLDIIMTENQEDKIKQCLSFLKMLPLPYMQENYQLTAVFTLLVLKKCCQSKKIRKNIDGILQTVFELSQHPPDLYQILPVEFIFCLKNQLIIDLLTLKIKNSNQQLVIKSLIESAVKRKRDESKISTKIVDLLVSRGNTVKSIETFSDTAFQMTCIILPIIVKHKKSITASGPRNILADFQEKLQNILVETFKNIDFTTHSSFVDKTGNTEDSLVENGGNLAILNALPAYTLTLSRYCETANVDKLKTMNWLWSGLEFFVNHSIEALKDGNTKPQHVEYSIQLLSITLRYIKKLESHPIFNEKDKLFSQIWSSLNSTLLMVFENEGNWKRCTFLDELGMCLKFVFELASVECFAGSIGRHLSDLVVLKPPKEIIKDKTQLPRHSVSKYLWIQLLRANIAGPKCGAITKITYQHCKTLNRWLYQNYDVNVASGNKRKLNVYDENRMIKIDDVVCNVIKINLETFAEVILAGKKVTLDYKFLDEIFGLINRVLCILGFNSKRIRCEISWQAFFGLFDGCVAMLNSLLVSREELLEDRWPCYMQCYRPLISVLCKKSTSETNFERHIEDKFSEIAHNVEKLTQSITKRKKQVSRISAYIVADICTYLEKEAPSKTVRQHLENSVALLIQASDSTYAIAFLKRALAGSVGQVTMSNLYTMYKRYHKYVGNA